MALLRPVLVLGALLAGAQGKKVGDQPVLYEISTRPWLYSLARSGIPARCGQYVCLRDVPLNQWKALADDSIDVVWLMGVWQLGDFGVQHDRKPSEIKNFKHDLPDVTPADVIGSPYAIQHYVVNSDIGTNEDLAVVRQTLNELGMSLMLDFVPNHAAVDSVLVAEHPSIFVQKPLAGSFPAKWWIERNDTTFAYGRGPYDGPWTDTLQYNYWRPDTVRVMTGILRTVASQADAIRCDMGMLILNDVIQYAWGDLMKAMGLSRPRQEFWKVAIDAVRERYPDTLFMAEAYDYGLTHPAEKQKLQELGFDIVYDKTVLDNLKVGNLDSIKGYIGSQSQDFFRHTAHFVENHDEPRSAALLGGPNQAFIGSVVASTIPGLRLFYFGQFDGFSAKLDVQLRRATAQAPNKVLHRQYTALLKVLADDVFHEGAWAYIPVSKVGTGWRLAAWRWDSPNGAAKRLVVVNYSDGMAWANVLVEDAEGTDGTDALVITELLTGERFTRSARQVRTSGLACGLAPWTAQIFSYGSTAEKSLLIA
mmetsp:Transcript_39437/g.89674  ORF Transcript_39437/g.89674 Transcript_39437/m.89674 type:complete len:535 (-) Transcript_39437:143-1747(-)